MDDLLEFIFWTIFLIGCPTIVFILIMLLFVL